MTPTEAARIIDETLTNYESSFPNSNQLEAMAVLDRVLQAAIRTRDAFRDYGFEGYYNVDQRERMEVRRKAALDNLEAVLGL